MGGGGLTVEPLDNGRWMWTADAGDGIHFVLGVERDEVSARRRARQALAHIRERRAEFERNVDDLT